MNMNSYTEIFSVPQHLVGLALGENGSNKMKAQSLKGIKKIDFNHKSCSFTITGCNEEIVRIVKNLLQYKEWEQPVARSLSELLQHGEGTLLQSIINNSGLVRAEIHDDDETIDKPHHKQSEYVGLKFVGTVTSINEAKSFLKTLKSSSEYSDFQAIKEANKKPPCRFTEKFQVAKHLVGLALGKNGCRIDEARKLPGIVRIKQDDLGGFSVFNVYSNDSKSAKEAREMLEFKEGTTYIPPNKIGLVIGAKGSNIQDITKKTHVHRIDVLEKEPNENGLIPVQIIGNPDQIEAAKLCISSKIGAR